MQLDSLGILTNLLIDNDDDDDGGVVVGPIVEGRKREAQWRGGRERGLWWGVWESERCRGGIEREKISLNFSSRFNFLMLFFFRWKREEVGMGCIFWWVTGFNFSSRLNFFIFIPFFNFFDFSVKINKTQIKILQYIIIVS